MRYGFSSRYPGTCAACGGQIKIGTPIKGDLKRRWVHAPHCDDGATLIRDDLPEPLPPKRRQPPHPSQRRRAHAR